MIQLLSPFPSFVFSAALAVYALSACDSDSGAGDNAPANADGGAAGVMPDASPLPGADAGPCVPGAESLVCKNASTVSFCSEDTDFDGMSDGAATLVEITCSAFFSDAGDASCESFDESSTEALCTMDDGGPCGVILVSGGFTSARCTSDDAVCLLNLEVQNYVCTPDSGISCNQAGPDFEPFCQGDKLVWRCTDDGDGTPQAHVDDCHALGGGSCNAVDSTCTGIELGGQCNLTEWLCGDDLKCQSNVCVPD